MRRITVTTKSSPWITHVLAWVVKDADEQKKILSCLEGLGLSDEEYPAGVLESGGPFYSVRMELDDQIVVHEAATKDDIEELLAGIIKPAPQLRKNVKEFLASREEDFEFERDSVFLLISKNK
jgi:hypothetical protein